MGCLASVCVGGGEGGYGMQGPTKTAEHLYVSFPPVITNWLLLFILMADIPSFLLFTFFPYIIKF